MGLSSGRHREILNNIFSAEGGKRLADMQRSTHAEVKRVIRGIQAALTCGICEETLENPYTLPCQHHFCWECLDNVEDRNMICPRCLVPFWRKDPSRNTSVANMVSAFNRLRQVLNVTPEEPNSAELHAPQSDCVDCPHPSEKSQPIVLETQKSSQEPSAGRNHDNELPNDDGGNQNIEVVVIPETPLVDDGPLSPTQMSDTNGLGMHLSQDDVATQPPISQPSGNQANSNQSQTANQNIDHEPAVIDMTLSPVTKQRPPGKEEEKTPKLAPPPNSPKETRIKVSKHVNPRIIPMVENTTSSCARLPRSNKSRGEQSRAEIENESPRRVSRKRKQSDGSNTAGKTARKNLHKKERIKPRVEVKTNRPGEPAQPVRPLLVATRMNGKQLAAIKKACKALGGLLLRSYHSRCTHVVTAAEKCEEGYVGKRTMKYLHGILDAKWIVSIDWLKKSIREGRWVDEAPYEVVGDTTLQITKAPSRAREANRNRSHKIFQGVALHFEKEYDRKNSPEAKVLKKIFKAGGGKVLTVHSKGKDGMLVCSPDISTVEANSIFKERGLEPISLMWILDSIGCYRLLEMEPFKLRFCEPSLSP